MDLARVLLLRARPADDGLQDDERRLARLGLRGLDRVVERGDVLDVLSGLLPVDHLHMPVVGLVAGLHVLGEGDVGVVLDRDLVAVVDRDEVAELLVTRERRCLARHALLHVAVAGDGVDEVVEGARADRCVRVEEAAFVAGGVGEADGRGEPLAERAGRDLHAVGVAVFGVPRGLGAPGAQRLEIVEFEAVAAEVQLHVLREGRVPDREDEAVPTDPVAVARVAAHDLLEEEVGGRSETHGGAGMTVPDLLDRIGGEDSRGVHGLVVNGIPLESCHENSTLLLRTMSVPGGSHRVRLGTRSPDDIGSTAGRPAHQRCRRGLGLRRASTSKYRERRTPPFPHEGGRDRRAQVRRLDSSPGRFRA
jgi:hypothetical protein